MKPGCNPKLLRNQRIGEAFSNGASTAELAKAHGLKAAQIRRILKRQGHTLKSGGSRPGQRAPRPFFEQIKPLLDQGMPLGTIAKHLGTSHSTVRRVMTANGIPAAATNNSVERAKQQEVICAQLNQQARAAELAALRCAYTLLRLVMAPAPRHEQPGWKPTAQK